jgi:hypothetical protein
MRDDERGPEHGGADREQAQEELGNGAPPHAPNDAARRFNRG